MKRTLTLAAVILALAACKPTVAEPLVTGTVISARNGVLVVESRQLGRINVRVTPATYRACKAKGSRLPDCYSRRSR